MRRDQVVGARSVDRFFDVTPGPDIDRAHDGAPGGAGERHGAAFGGACSGVNSSSNPVSISDPTAGLLVAGVPVTSTVSLRRNGIGNIGLDFDDDAGTRRPTPGVGVTRRGHVPRWADPVLGACTDVSSNTANCGGCGHACPTGASAPPRFACAPPGKCSAERRASTSRPASRTVECAATFAPAISRARAERATVRRGLRIVTAMKRASRRPSERRVLPAAALFLRP